MADTKSGRAKRALKEQNRQRQREIEEELERLDETEPSDDAAGLEEIDLDI
jgi:hypothetical protein